MASPAATVVYPVVIVGAGAAGLAAANFFHSIDPSPFSYKVLEARDRVGGRAHTDYLWHHYPIELGAEFIHGDRASTHNLVQMSRCHILPVSRFSEMNM